MQQGLTIGPNLTAVPGLSKAGTSDPALDQRAAADMVTYDLYAQRNTGIPVSPAIAYGTSLPKKSEYIEADGRIKEEWFRDCALYCIRDSRDIVLSGMRAAAQSIRAATRITDSDTLPLSGLYPISGIPGMETPYINVVAPMIDILQGEFASLDPEISCSVSNPSAASRRKTVHHQLVLAQILERVNTPAQMIQSMGLPNASKVLEEFGGSVEAYMELGYKDSAARAMEAALRDFVERTKFKDWANQTHKRYLITDRAYSDPYIDPETLEIVNPLVSPVSFFADSLCDDNFFEDAKFTVRIEYMREEEAKVRFPTLSPEDIKAGEGVLGEIGSEFFYSRTDRSRYVMVCYVTYVYPEEAKVTRTVQEDSEIGLSGQQKSFAEEEVVVRYEQLYTCVLVGGQVVAQAGVYPYQCRRADRPSKAILPSTSLVYDNSLSPTAPSRMMRLMAMAAYANRILYELIEQVSRMSGAILVIRASKIPTLAGKDAEESLREYVRNIREERVIIEDDRFDPEDPDTRPAVTVQSLDGRISEEISARVSAYDLILREIRRVSGISEARTGQAGQYQTTGTALQNKTQSDFATQDRSRAFESFLERTLSTIANLIKIRISTLSSLAEEGDAYAKSLLESERIRLGDENVDILGSDESMLSDYGVSVRLGQSVDSINQQIDMMADLMVQQKTAPDLALMNAEIKMRRTPAEKLEVIRRSVVKMQAQAAAEQQAAMEQQQAQASASPPGAAGA